MKKINFTNKNKEDSNSPEPVQKEETKSGKQYEKFYNMVKKRLHTL